ncbi:Nuclear pore complex protein Nup107 [Trichoplax sp. H2]|nr:Nuclear pore complex protein Nup107 [Trichoplax sp. H2]|eukprot:RDD42741.1 Nuclear pore complex protein Nup107 [Trichoplax sp. H2]
MAESKFNLGNSITNFSTPHLQKSIAGLNAESGISSKVERELTPSVTFSSKKHQSDFENDQFKSPAISNKDIKKIENRLFEIRQSLQQSFSKPSELDKSQSSFSSQNLELGPVAYQDSVMLMDHRGLTAPTIVTKEISLDEDAINSRKDDRAVTDYVDQIETDFSGLIEDFFKIYTASTRTLDPLEAVKEYEKICHEHLLMLESAVKKLVPGQRRSQILQEKITELKSEKYTWRLIHSIYKDRLLSSEERMDLENSLLDLIKNQSDKKIVDNLYDKDGEIRQAQLVIDWLENNAGDELVNFHEKVEYFSRQVCWENTLHDMLFPKLGSPTVVKEMDPDAPIRSGLPLMDLDEEDDARLLKHIFRLVRAGQVTKAQEVCIRCGQAWRAATLEGWKMWHDENLESGKNLFVMIAKFNRYERALYGCLSGNLEKVIPVCESWDDYLWAYYKCFIDERVEQEIRSYPRLFRTLVPLPVGLTADLNPEKIFDALDNNSNESVRHHASCYYQTAQKHVILDDVNDFLAKSISWIGSNERSSDVLRFLTHLALFLRGIGLNLNDEVCDNVIELYVQGLIKAEKIELVATYTAALPSQSQIAVYAKFLEGIHDKSERQRCLLLGEQAGLNTDAITKAVVVSVHQFRRSDVSRNIDITKIISGDISDTDREKIDAIEWMIFNPSQRIEAIKHANAVMRYFIACRKHSAAREVYTKVPSGSIDLVYKQWQTRAGESNLPADDDNAIREFLCIQAYLDAHEAFTEWFQQYYHGKPEEPHVTQISRQQSIAKIAYEEKTKAYRLELERWERNIEIYSKDAIEKLYNVLLFVDGGWMVDARTDAVVDESRKHQLEVLRQLCLPLICFLLQTVLQATQQYDQSLRLAVVIASEQYKLYETFRPDELQQFLRLLCESAKEILSQPQLSDENNDK